MTIFDKIEIHYKLQKPFVVYRKPNEKVISGFFQNTKEIFYVDDYSEAGFVFSPFNNREKGVLIPVDESEYYEETLFLDSFFTEEIAVFPNDTSSKEEHLKLIMQALREIKKNQFEKVVVSRQVQQKISNFKLVDSYQKLLHKYPNAFGYIWYHPQIGLWMGATPETLLTISDGHFKTMSLAGTQAFNDTQSVIWKSKELEEQALVTTFITSQLDGLVSNLKIDKKETIKAGNLLHLRTKISGEIELEHSSLKILIDALHPTPAVCGLPRLKTQQFISENENYTRSYYTGFLGELNLRDQDSYTRKSAFFVNLRCMEIEKENAVIYVGGGITKDSDPLKEWEETVSKSRVMKAVL